MFLCCGDALFDLFSEPTNTVGSVSLNGHVGGSPLNVANGLARLGNPAGYLCKNSTDMFGQRIKQFLIDNAVSPDWIIETNLNSTLAIVETGSNGSAEYVFYTDNTADLSMTEAELPTSLPDAVKVIHVGSYSTAVAPTANTLATLIHREKTQRVISYDPNIRASIEPDIDVWRERFSTLASASDFIKASDEDIETLFGSQMSLENFATDTLQLGASLVVVTRGPNGATLYCQNGNQASASGLDVSVVDTVGAGDTFQAASLHWLEDNNLIDNGTLHINDIDLNALVTFAVQAAAITCTRRGADLPTIAQIQAFQAKL